jgi:hypothetical protein
MLFWWLGPWSHAQLVAAGLGFGLFTFFGLFILMLWVPDYDKTDEVATERIKGGWLFILIGLFLGVFGMFGFLLMCAAFVVFLCWVVYRSVKIAFNRG